MFLVDQLILLGGVLLLLGIASSKVSARVGLPVLVLFLGVGMLAGEDGVGRIEFDDFVVAHAIGTVALAVILFDGGLQTRASALAVAWKPAALLATAGVAITAAVAGLAASAILGLPPLAGLLLGSIVASTDAAAVFSVLRSQGVQLPPRLAAVLEIESGSNDPMAIFLTIGVVEALVRQGDLGAGLLGLFIEQMGIGAFVGLTSGWLAVRLINRVNLGTAGLYPVLAATCGFVAFGLAAVLGGSGFLSIYLAGIVLGNSRVVFQRGTLLFLDGLAWIGQIAMFVVLGLLSTPSELVAVAGPSLAVAAVLVLVARPAAVFLLMWPFGFSGRELLLVSWVGLKGAVPIILATFPMMFEVPNGRLVFDVVFFVVLVSATLQGWTLPWLSRRLGLHEPRPPAAAVSLELLALRELKADVIEFRIEQGGPLAGRQVRDLGLPEGAVLALVARGRSLVAPRGATRLDVGDHLFVIAREDLRARVDAVMSGGPGPGPDDGQPAVRTGSPGRP